MKDIRRNLCLLIAAALLAGCTPQPQPQTTSLPRQEAQQQEVEVHLPELEPEPAAWTLLYQMYGASSLPGDREIGAEGLFRVEWTENGAHLLLHLDPEKREMAPLCFLEGCAHGDESCDAYWQENNGGGVGSKYFDGTLLVWTVSVAEYHLFRVDIETGKREEIEILEDDQLVESIAISGDWLWLGRATHTPQEGTSVPLCEVEHILYNLETGEERPVGVSGYRLLGTWEKGVVVQDGNTGSVTVEPLTGYYEEHDVDFWLPHYVHEGSAYLSGQQYDEEDQPTGTGEIRRLHIETGEEELFLETDGYFSIDQVLEGKLLCTHGPFDTELYRAVIDIETGEIQRWNGSQPAHYEGWGTLGTYKGRYLIQFDGVFGFIDKADFWAGNLENVDEITRAV